MHVNKWLDGGTRTATPASGVCRQLGETDVRETEFMTIAVYAARAAGTVLQDWSQRFSVREKSPANLVTEADFASQECIHGIIHEAFPTHAFLGEEGLSESHGHDEFRWIIDPLDGTSNYVHRFPYYAVSIALQDGAGLRLGVIFDPNRDELFAAERDRGACLNGEAIAPTQTAELSQAMAVASLPVAARRGDPAVRRFLNVLGQAQTVQRTGSAALNLAYVACGRIDAFWSSSLKPWDMAAGAVLVAEAGGRITQLDGSAFDVDVPSLLATNGQGLHAHLEELLSETRPA